MAITLGRKFRFIPFVRTLLVLLFNIFLFSGNSFGQQVLLNLFPEGKTRTPTAYEIGGVVDQRNQKSKIGDVFRPGGEKISVTFKGNLDQLVSRLFSQSIDPKDSASRIQVRIYELELKETFNQNQKLYEGNIELGIGFFLMGSNEPVHLQDFLGSSQYRRSGFTMDKVENVVNRLFLNGLDYFHNWYLTQNLNNRTLAKTIRLEIINQLEKSSADKVVYDLERKLVWGDFRDKPRPSSRNNATIFTSFSVQGVSLMDSGSVVQTLEVSVYMVPTQSWVKTPSEYALNHEQRHFDIVRIVADRLIHKLKMMDLDLDFYQAKINEGYLDAYREMNRLQEFYDKQTQNGINTEEQAKWNQWIDEGLAGEWEKFDELLSAGRK